MKLFFIILVFSMSLFSQDKMHNEIKHLLNYVETTECVYIRNGDRHEGPDAMKHIKRKYDYFEDDIDSAEDFIRFSATKSMMSGSKYYIKCPGKHEVESGLWLLEELARYRKLNTKEKNVL